MSDELASPTPRPEPELEPAKPAEQYAATRLATRLMVWGSLVLVFVVLLYILRGVLGPLVLAVMLAYLLDGPVEWVSAKTKSHRTLIISVVYLAFVGVLTLSLVILVPAIGRQIGQAGGDIQASIQTIRAAMQSHQTIEIFEYTIDLTLVLQALIDALGSGMSTITTTTAGAVISVFARLAWFVFIMVVAFYLLKDSRAINKYVVGLIPPIYHDEFSGIMSEINDVLRAFVRGQVILMLIIGFVTWAVLTILGVRNALLLGIIAGSLEIVPNLGPFLAAVPAVALALFQHETFFGMDNLWFAVVVALAYTMIQQLENTIVVPQVMGRSVQLHPVIILIGVLVGGSFAGVLGIFLAAPTIAVLRIIARRLQPLLVAWLEQGHTRAGAPPSG